MISHKFDNSGPISMKKNKNITSDNHFNIQFQTETIGFNDPVGDIQESGTYQLPTKMDIHGTFGRHQKIPFEPLKDQLKSMKTSQEKILLKNNSSKVKMMKDITKVGDFKSKKYNKTASKFRYKAKRKNVRFRNI